MSRAVIAGMLNPRATPFSEPAVVLRRKRTRSDSAYVGHVGHVGKSCQIG